MNDVNINLLPPTAAMWAIPRTVVDQPLIVQMGDLCLTICRMKHEWQLNYQWSKMGNNGGFSCHYCDTSYEAPQTVERIAMETMSDQLVFSPKLADRPVVVRPYSPLIIPANNSITLYVSTPLWLDIEFSSNLKLALPLQQLSDTWMGSLTGKGELCYGSQTHARLDEELLLKLPYRALTPVIMQNYSDEKFTLERLSIPSPYLSLYQGDGQLVTEPLSFAMDKKTQPGIVKIGSSPHQTLITSPQKQAYKGILTNAWENLFA